MNEEMKDELKQLLDSRTAAYQFLSRLYRVEIDEEFLGQLMSMRFPANTGSAETDAGYRQIRDYLSAPHADVLTELAVDYTRTFIGGGNNGYSAAYPFESVYTSPKRLLMQGARDDVLVIYRAAGIDKKASWTDGEDHIALELEFMQILSDRASKALGEGDEEAVESNLRQQKRFLTDHLRAWYPMMAADMKKFSKTDFYRGLADITMGFFAIEKEFLDEILEAGEE